MCASVCVCLSHMRQQPNELRRRSLLALPRQVSCSRIARVATTRAIRISCAIITFSVKGKLSLIAQEQCSQKIPFSSNKTLILIFLYFPQHFEYCVASTINENEHYPNCKKKQNCASSVCKSVHL